MDENVFEYASEYSNNMVSAALKVAQEANKAETHPDFDGSSCIECGDEIPEGRLALGKIRCVICQSAREKR